MTKLSVVINTLNEEENISKAISSVKKIADEIVVVDMESSDNTVSIAKKLGAKVYSHKKTGYVEPARNFGISKANGEWVFILDADETVGSELGVKIKKMIDEANADYYRVPRKNIIFGKWINHSRWWPDMNIRLFKKGKVVWSEEIHKVPVTTGKGADLPEDEAWAITHNNYESIDAYLERMIRYTKIQSREYIKNGYKFEWMDLIKKPFGEFLSRYFAGEGYKDGLHGLVLASLQSLSELVLYVRLWQEYKFEQKNLSTKEIKNLFTGMMNELKWWIRKELSWLKSLRSA